MDTLRSIALFIAAAVAEIGGAWLVWQGVREHRGWIWVGAGVIALGLYGFVATLQPDPNFGRILAAYAHSKLADSTAKRDTVSVGYNYDFSKRTDGYAIVMYDKVKDFGNGTSFGVGIRHRF